MKNRSFPINLPISKSGFVGFREPTFTLVRPSTTQKQPEGGGGDLQREFALRQKGLKSSSVLTQKRKLSLRIHSPLVKRINLTFDLHDSQIPCFMVQLPPPP